MSAVNTAVIRRNAVASARTTQVVPSLSVVPSPTPSKGFFGTVALCATILFLALCAAFFLNTAMVQGAYEVKSVTVELNELESQVETMSSQAVTIATPTGLQKSAKKLGMVPATDVKYLDYNTGKISGGETTGK